MALILILACCADASIKISVDKKGTYIYWLAYKDAKGQDSVTTPARFKGQEVEIKDDAVPAKIPAVKLHIVDKRSGNEAIKEYKIPADPKKAQPVKISESDFQYVPVVSLKVVSEDGAPIESGSVALTDGEGTVMHSILTPANGGTAAFNDVATGDIEVKVDTAGIKKTIDGAFPIADKRDTPGFEKTIKVSGDVATLQIAANQGQSAKPAAKPEQQSGGAGFLQAIVGFIILAMIIAVAYVILKSKGFDAKNALNKMGVQIPEDQKPESDSQQSAASAVDPNVCQFCGQMKDANGHCACTLAASAPSPFASAATGEPRLIGSQGTYSGSIFKINGSAEIGREETNDVALPNDHTVSRKHATISSANGGYSIRDEGSSNGTFVNGAKITEQKLSAGDEVQIGGTKFRFEI